MMPTRSHGLWIFVLGVMTSGSARASETVGPYTIDAAPTAAVLVSGGGPSFNWLNVINTPVTVDAALSGFRILDDGYGNAQSGTTLRLTFAPGVLQNHAGPDLVLLDAQNDLNVYLVATSHDNFAQSIVVSATTDTGVDRNYYFGGTGPATYDVMAVAIDLSSLNVPDGQSVDQVRLFTEGPSNDPLGLGVLAAPAQVPVVGSLGLLGLVLLLFAIVADGRRRRGSQR